MPASTRKFRPPHTSERKMDVLNSCRFHALVIVRAMETNGEQLIRKNGRPYTHSGRLKLAELLRYHAAQRRGEDPLEADGFNRDQALYAYSKVFKTGRAEAADLTPAQMREALEDGWALTVSGNVDSVPNASPLDDFVGEVPHEIAVLPFPTDYGPLVDEAMRPQGKGLIRVSWRALNRFTSEFRDSQNRRHCIKVKAGWDTAEARTDRRLSSVVNEKERTINRVRDARDDAQAQLSAARLENAALVDQLAECRDDGCDAKVEGALDSIQERIDELRAAL